MCDSGEQGRLSSTCSYQPQPQHHRDHCTGGGGGGDGGGGDGGGDGGATWQFCHIWSECLVSI